MAARLGNVIYWACSGVTTVVLLAGLAFAWTTDRNASAALIVSGIVGGGFWLVGRAARYVLAGR